MKTLKSFLVNEDFKNPYFRELLTQGQAKNWLDPYWKEYKLAWDKIGESDLIKYDDMNEAVKVMRSRKDGAKYVIWVTKRYRDPGNCVYAITVGTDVVWNGSGIRMNSMTSTAQVVGSCTFVYALEVLDWQKFSTKDLRDARREARSGAAAFLKDREVLAANMYRYKEAISKLHVSKEKSGTIQRFKDIMNRYGDMAKDWATNITDIIISDSPSSFKAMSNWKKINNIIEELCSKIESVNYKHSEFKWIETYIKEAENLMDTIEQLSQQITLNNQ